MQTDATAVLSSLIWSRVVRLIALVYPLESGMALIVALIWEHLDYVHVQPYGICPPMKVVIDPDQSVVGDEMFLM